MNSKAIASARAAQLWQRRYLGTTLHTVSSSAYSAYVGSYLCFDGRLFLLLPIFVMCDMLTYFPLFRSYLRIFVVSTYLCNFMHHPISMDVIVCLAITYIAIEGLCHCNFVQTTC